MDMSRSARERRTLWAPVSTQAKTSAIADSKVLEEAAVKLAMLQANEVAEARKAATEN
jgi:hypothetical protein